MKNAKRYEVPEQLLTAYRQYTIPDFMEATEVGPTGFTATPAKAARIFDELTAIKLGTERVKY